MFKSLLVVALLLCVCVFAKADEPVGTESQLPTITIPESLPSSLDSSQASQVQAASKLAEVSGTEISAEELTVTPEHRESKVLRQENSRVEGGSASVWKTIFSAPVIEALAIGLLSIAGLVLLFRYAAAVVYG